MISFLEEVINDVWSKHTNHENIVFVLPSKRAGFFLKNCVTKVCAKTQFSPEIYSIETFVECISGLSYASNTVQLFQLYNSYLATEKGEKDNFYTFSKWGQTLLQDFNEVDRYLVNSKKLFSHLSAVQEINHWYLQKERTQIIENYIRFWNNLEDLYESFNTTLAQKGIGSQGLVYRVACKNLNSYLDSNTEKKFIFIGFNALNEAESYIIQDILEKAKADIYWDNDPYFVDDYIHDAGYFIRQHKKNWSYFDTNPIKGIKENYLNSKNIHIIGVPKSVSQAKYVGNLLQDLKSNSPELVKNTAVVLADETLLNPILNSVPKEIEGVNITMGYPLQKTALASLFTNFIELTIYKDKRGYFHKEVLTFLSHPDIHVLLTYDGVDYATSISEEIKSKNWIYISSKKLQKLMNGKREDINIIFPENILNPTLCLENCLQIILSLKLKFTESNSALGLEYLYRFNQLFNQISTLLKEHSFITDLKSLHSLYTELLSSETLDFKGEPLKGLQIMGMLESRNLDFETVIITSVNEGILPSGKSNNSFIPFDIKNIFGLPTYKEKDAIYTYHFYRLLQRAKNVYLLYNTEPDVLEGGEKSRLITQLLTDENRVDDIVETIAFPKIEPTNIEKEVISKDASLMKLIETLAGKGFSPSSLANYIRNPIGFYKQNLLKINDTLEVEETIAANTFGTIVHDTLEELYLPFIGTYLEKEKLNDLKPKVKAVVLKHFELNYSDGDITRGKNLIAFKVILRHIENFINLEIGEVENSRIKIIGLETNLNVSIDIPELNFPVILKGKLDRIDEVDGVTRIIDYKTGKVDSPELAISNWEELTTTTKYSKAFQLLCYAEMYSRENPKIVIEAGIISFKNLKSGVLRFAQKEKTKNYSITENTLELFQIELKRLIIEICNPEIPFVEKEV
ncbi:MAG: PD-(D/E)XK nuclease family protein [Cellulophaga sp.]